MSYMDWGTIATFSGAFATVFAAIVAWKISEKWRHQKSSEVLANEAKLLVSDLFAFNSLIVELKNIQIAEKNEIDHKINDYKILTSAINNRINFLTIETFDDKQANDFIEEYRNYNEKFFDSFLQPYINIRDPISAVTSFKLRFNTPSTKEEKIISHIMLINACLLRIYRDIALYKIRKKDRA